ncbi:hypothetical protein A9Q89_01885 [Gammaproteobacteria bacterium 53_120_T64]|nr:hypothetical protein A9Q89_01885 [Gammaproteobacteria bacterium 53_120_T64]
MTDQEPTLTHDGKDYKISDLSKEAQDQLQSLQLAEAEIKRLQMQLAMVQTARNAYQQALVAALPQDAH